MEKLLNNASVSFDKIINYLKDDLEYRKYKDIENKLRENKEINKLIEKIKKLQQEEVKLRYSGHDTCIKEKEIKEQLEKLNSYPLYLEFLIYQEKINNRIQNIKGMIEGYFDNITK